MTAVNLKQTVFVVDDDPAASESVAALVQSQGLSVQTFSSAEDFLARFDRTQRGCVVLDVRMTGQTGVELLEQLQSEGFALPVIIITGFGNVPLAVRAMRAGAYSFLEKGGSEQELSTTVQEALTWETRSREKETLRQEVRQRAEREASDVLRDIIVVSAPKLAAKRERVAPLEPADLIIEHHGGIATALRFV